MEGGVSVGFVVRALIVVRDRPMRANRRDSPLFELQSSKVPSLHGTENYRPGLPRGSFALPKIGSLKRARGGAYFVAQPSGATRFAESFKKCFREDVRA